MPAEERGRIEEIVPPMRAHLFVVTSGSTGTFKIVALSKQAVLASAIAVNERLVATNRDIWCRVLPLFHVGGLGILARAHVSGARVIEREWDPQSFAESG